MSSPTEKIEVVVGDFPTNAALYNLSGVRTLFLHEDQTFSTAVRSVCSVVHGITVEAAEQLVREHCPELSDFDDMLGPQEAALPRAELPLMPLADECTKPADRGWRRKVVLVAALLPALVGSFALGRYPDLLSSHTTQTPAAAPDDAATTVAAAPFNDSNFDYFAGSSHIECNPISTLEAECTDADGMVMSTKAATGPDSTIFTFSYGSERIGLRIFYDAEYAQTWARQDGSKELYPNMRVHGRYVLWGTDQERIGEYSELLQEPKAKDKTMAAPLPPRLAALTLGTLGLDRQAVNRIIAEPELTAIDAPSYMAARLVLGLDATPAWPVHGGDDIVAIAAGIEPKPPTAVPAVAVPVPREQTTEPEPQPTAPPADSTPSSDSGGTPTTPATDTPAPAEETPPQDPPVEETPTTTPTESTPPAESEPPPADDTPDEAAPTETPAEETPPAEVPVEEVPAPQPITETPAEIPPATGTVEDLLILDSAWTVAS